MVLTPTPRETDEMLEVDSFIRFLKRTIYYQIGENHENSRCLDKVALAFQELINDYEDKKRDKWGYSPFSVGPHAYSHFSSFFMHIDGDLGKFIDWSRESIEAIQETVRIIGFGIDYKKYARFKLLTPIIVTYVGGNYEFNRKDKSPSSDDIRFCIDFVVESAIALQEFDFQVVKEG